MNGTGETGSSSHRPLGSPALGGPCVERGFFFCRPLGTPAYGGDVYS